MKTIARALIAAFLCQPILPTLTAKGATRTSRTVYAYKGRTRFVGEWLLRRIVVTAPAGRSA